MTVTPVLADQLEAPGCASACASSWSSGGSAPPKPTSPKCRRSAAPPARPSWPATGRRWSCSTRPAGTRCAPFQRAAAEGRVALAASSATHAVLPLLATRAGAAAAARRRHPLAPPPLRLGRRLLAARVRLRAGPRVAAGRGRGRAGSASTRAPTRRRCRRWRRCATPAGPVALPIDWEAIGWLWSLDGYPSDPAHAQFAGKSLRGVRLWKVGGGAYDPAAAAAAARRQARRVPRRRRGAPAPTTPSEHGRRGLLVFAIDTELLGHWWSEGPIWLRAVLEGAAAAGVRTVTVPQALAEHEPVERELAASTWGEGKDFAHLGLARRRRPRLGRRGGWSCGCCGRSRAASTATPRCAPRASCWPPRPATGPSSTSAARRATTPTSGPPTTPGPCWRP